MGKILRFFTAAALVIAVGSIPVGTARAVPISYLGDLTDGVYHDNSVLGFWTLSVNAGDFITVQANRKSAVDLDAGAWDGLESDTIDFPNRSSNSTSHNNVGNGDDNVGPIYGNFVGACCSDPLFSFTALTTDVYTIGVARFSWTFDTADYEVRATGSTVSASAVPLPAALPLFGSGLGVLGLLGWHRKRKKAMAAA